MSFRQLGWPALASLFCVLITAALIALDRRDGSLLLGSFPLQVLGLVLIGVSIAQARHWWLLILAPILAFPLLLWISLLYQCSQGNCL